MKKTLGELDSKQMTTGWQRFFELVSKTYFSADDERALLNRSLDISSKEYAEARIELAKESARKDLQFQEVKKDKDSYLQKIITLEKDISELEQKILNINQN